MATNPEGFLPPNIVKPFWGNLQNVPEGFADGVDDGITQISTHLADSPPVTIAADDNGTALATCPAGTKVLSGGGTASSFLVHMVTSFQAGNGWIVAYQNTDTVNARTITAIATCATVTPASAIATTAKRARATSLLPDD